MTKILEATEQFNHCQRNWDMSKPVDADTIKYLIDVGNAAPKKQNIVNFHTICIKDQNLVSEIAQYCYSSHAPKKLWEEHPSGRHENPQVKAPLLILFVVDIDYRSALEHSASFTLKDDMEQVSLIEIGIAASAIGIAANDLGLRTGFNSCVNTNAMPEYIPGTKIKSLNIATTMGIGYPQYDQDQHHIQTDKLYEHDRHLNSANKSIIL
ncbi:nitroreductase family protein [bacterium]|nr:nitroreductase family protein [bacterium]